VFISKCLYVYTSHGLYVYTSHGLYVYTSHPLEPLIIKKVISIATTTKTTIECKLLSIQEELDILNTVDGT
jgi:hypothetical protein